MSASVTYALMQLQFAKLDVSTAGYVASLFSVKRPQLSLGNENSLVKFTSRTNDIKASPILLVNVIIWITFLNRIFTLLSCRNGKY